jgi:hypothetical protein
MSEPCHKPLRDEFLCGFACAVATLARHHGMPALAAMICQDNGISLSELIKGGVDAYDIEPLREELRNRQRPKLGAKR